MSFAHRTHNPANDSHIDYINADSSLSCAPLKFGSASEAGWAVQRADAPDRFHNG
jgi:hypothetical protein